MNFDDIVLEMARSIFILSYKESNKKNEPWLFLFDINDWLTVEHAWMAMSNDQKNILIEDAKLHLNMLKDNFPIVYEIIITRIIPSNHKKIDYLFENISI